MLTTKRNDTKIYISELSDFRLLLIVLKPELLQTEGEMADRFGCALLHEGNVFVEKRECTSAMCVIKSSSFMSP